MTSDEISITLGDVQSLLLRHCRHKSTKTAIPYLTLYCCDNITDPLLVVYEPRIYLIIQGAKTIRIHKRSFHYDENYYLVATVDLPLSGHITRATAEEPYLAACISFDPDEIRDIIARTAARPGLNAPLATSLGLSRVTPDLLALVHRLLRALDAGDHGFMAPLIKQELLYRVLQGDQGHVLHEIANRKSDASRINRALAHMRAHFTGEDTATALHRLAGMGQSTFYRKFQQITGLSPVQYRKRLRLQEARRLILHEDRLAADAGFAVGYESPSHFTRDYKAIYGLPPHRDVARIRAIGVDRYREMNEDVWI
ncbi:AraC family transcriptional regulator [Asaia krungthepensis]|uniref:AraC family transcriptional regulator n=1 Tax=Asaia krungthepensis NRIC 0535 TaxID=1307925 RepID=A0ABQ0PWS8_9PROT|nr:AraC family transcriptional regulator [Asaia krungthepensis]GBQ83479.1 AraC family transcriptional regulator [Asaia krungthepensis NRIC 0535]